MILRIFKYVARNADGKTVRGRIEANDREVAAQFLKTKNYVNLQLVEYRSVLSRLNQVSFGKSLKTTQMIFFLRQLGSLLKAGVTILPALELLSLQQDKHRLRLIMFEVYQQVYNGLSLSKALASRPKEFPKLLVLMVEVGEISGTLADTIVAMASYYDRQAKIGGQIKGAIRMPVIYLAAALVIAAGMILFVFPNITGLFASFGDAELPGITKFFLATGDFAAAHALPIFGGGAALLLLLVYLNKHVSAFHRFLVVLTLRMPIAGPLIRMANQILIAGSLSQMMENGINSVTALQTVRSVVTNVVYKDLITKTLAYVDDGWPFARAFEESEFIDPIMARMIATGERTGDVPGLMKNLSIYYDGISEQRVEQIKNAIQPILLLFVYALVGVMIIALMLPMISLGSQI
jgi:type IV pilus assembly protein PilC